MSEDSTTRTLGLANGVRLTWPSSLDEKELIYSYQKLGSFIDLLKRASTDIDFEHLIDGTILQGFSDVGSNPVS